MAIETVVIHAGPPKTGTTTIQAFMYRARDTLRQAGILYPDAGRIADDRSFRVRRPTGWMTKHGPGIGHHLLPWTLLDEVEGLHATDCWGELVDEFRRAPERIAVISSEAFSRLDRQRVDAVRRYLQGFEVRVVSYLRSPFSRMLSDYTQRVKSGRYHRSFGEFIVEERALLENYDGFLRFWDDAFGRERVSIRDFERAQTLGSLELDFARSITKDLDTLREFLPPAPLNVSPDSGTVERMRRLNRLEASMGRPRVLRRLFDGLRRLARAPFVGNMSRSAAADSLLYREDDRSGVERFAGPRYAELAERASAGDTESRELTEVTS